MAHQHSADGSLQGVSQLGCSTDAQESQGSLKGRISGGEHGAIEAHNLVKQVGSLQKREEGSAGEGGPSLSWRGAGMCMGSEQYSQVEAVRQARQHTKACRAPLAGPSSPGQP